LNLFKQRWYNDISKFIIDLESLIASFGNFQFSNNADLENSSYKNVFNSISYALSYICDKYRTIAVNNNLPESILEKKSNEEIEKSNEEIEKSNEEIDKAIETLEDKLKNFVKVEDLKTNFFNSLSSKDVDLSELDAKIRETYINAKDLFYLSLNFNENDIKTPNKIVIEKSVGLLKLIMNYINIDKSRALLPSLSKGVNPKKVKNKFDELKDLYNNLELIDINIINMLSSYIDKLLKDDFSNIEELSKKLSEEFDGFYKSYENISKIIDSMFDEHPFLSYYFFTGNKSVSLFNPYNLNKDSIFYNLFNLRNKYYEYNKSLYKKFNNKITDNSFKSDPKVLQTISSFCKHVIYHLNCVMLKICDNLYKCNLIEEDSFKIFVNSIKETKDRVEAFTLLPGKIVLNEVNNEQNFSGREEKKEEEKEEKEEIIIVEKVNTEEIKNNEEKDFKSFSQKVAEYNFILTKYGEVQDKINDNLKNNDRKVYRNDIDNMKEMSKDLVNRKSELDNLKNTISNKKYSYFNKEYIDGFFEKNKYDDFELYSNFIDSIDPYELVDDEPPQIEEIHINFVEKSEGKEAFNQAVADYLKKVNNYKLVLRNYNNKIEEIKTKNEKMEYISQEKLNEDVEEVETMYKNLVDLKLNLDDLKSNILNTDYTPITKDTVDAFVQDNTYPEVKDIPENLKKLNSIVELKEVIIVEQNEEDLQTAFKNKLNNFLKERDTYNITLGGYKEVMKEIKEAKADNNNAFDEKKFTEAVEKARQLYKKLTELKSKLDTLKEEISKEKDSDVINKAHNIDQFLTTNKYEDVPVMLEDDLELPAFIVKTIASLEKSQ